MKKVAIIGGGIIGLSCAYYLQKEGCEVIVIDHDNRSEGSSVGNAGMIVPSHIIPLAAPGMISKGIRWMFNSESPFYIKPRLNGSLLKWGWKFYQSATEKNVEKSIPLLRDLSLLGRQLYSDLSKEISDPFLFSERGLLMLYKTESTEKEETETAHLANQAGVKAEILNKTEVQKLETEIEVDVSGGIFFPGDAHLDPSLFVNALKKYLNSHDVRLISGNRINDFVKNGNLITEIRTDDEVFQAEEFIIATGSWSPILTQKLGLDLLLQAGKGYSFTQPEMKKNIQIPSILLERRVAVTPMGTNLRIGGTMEISGIDLSVNPKRVEGIFNSISMYYPNLKIEKPELIWRGLRPCSPDGLPYIGRMKSWKNVIVATGHGMMGLSLGPATGKIISEIISNKTTSMNIDAFSPDRF